MASSMRYRGGDCKPLAMKTSSSYPIEAGDLCYKDPTTGEVRPASALADQGTADQNAEAFGLVFAGVALHKTGLQVGEKSFLLTTDPGYTLVATAGDFEFDCAATVWVPGDCVGIASDADGCLPQKVAKVAYEAYAIGKAVPGYNQLGQSATSVVVRIRSQVMEGGLNDVGSGT